MVVRGALIDAVGEVCGIAHGNGSAVIVCRALDLPGVIVGSHVEESIGSGAIGAFYRSWRLSLVL